MRDGAIVEDRPLQSEGLAGREPALLVSLSFEFAAVAGLEEGVHGGVDRLEGRKGEVKKKGSKEVRTQ